MRLIHIEKKYVIPPKYKPTIDTIKREKDGFTAAKQNPEEYLKAIFKAKMDGKIK